MDVKIAKAAQPVIKELATELHAPVKDVAKIAARLIDDSRVLDEGEARRAVLLHQQVKNETGGASEQELLAAFEQTANAEFNDRKQLYGELIAVNNGHTPRGRDAYTTVANITRSLNTHGVDISMAEVADAYKRLLAVDNSCHSAATESLHAIAGLLNDTPDLGVTFEEFTNLTEAALSHALPAIQPDPSIRDNGQRAEQLYQDIRNRAFQIAGLFEIAIDVGKKRGLTPKEAVGYVPQAAAAERGSSDTVTTLIDWLKSL